MAQNAVLGSCRYLQEQLALFRALDVASARLAGTIFAGLLDDILPRAERIAADLRSGRTTPQAELRRRSGEESLEQ